MKFVLFSGFGRRQYAQIIAKLDTVIKQGTTMSDEFQGELSTLEGDVNTLKVNSDAAVAALDDLLAKSTNGTQVTTEDLQRLKTLHDQIAGASGNLSAAVAKDDPTNTAATV